MKLTKKVIDALVFEMINSYPGAIIEEEENYIPENNIRAVLEKFEV